MSQVAIASGKDVNECSPPKQAMSDNNEVFIKTWAPKFKLMNDGIPELSPKENAWLDGELESKNQKRILTVYSSKEFAIRFLKIWATSLENSTYMFTDNAETWSYITQLFLDINSTIYLMKLVEDGVINKDIIPCEWRTFDSTGELMIRMRIFYAQHILSKNLINSLKK